MALDIRLCVTNLCHRSIVVEHIKSRISNSEIRLAYFYCSRNPAEPERTQPAAILSCIIKQFCFPENGEPIRNAVLESHFRAAGIVDRSTALDVNQCERLIAALVDDLNTFIIVDGLDECDKADSQVLLWTFSRIMHTSTRGLKVFYSSRYEWAFMNHFTQIATTMIELPIEKNAMDLQSYVEAQVHKAIKMRMLLKGQVPPSLEQEINQVLVQGADGM